MTTSCGLNSAEGDAVTTDNHTRVCLLVSCFCFAKMCEKGNKARGFSVRPADMHLKERWQYILIYSHFSIVSHYYKDPTKQWATPL